MKILGVVMLLLFPAPKGEIGQGFFGVTMTFSMGVGVVVSTVVPGGPAENNLQTDDVILKVNGAIVTDLQQCIELVKRTRPGEMVNVLIKRDGKELAVRFKPGERPADLEP